MLRGSHLADLLQLIHHKPHLQIRFLSFVVQYTKIFNILTLHIVAKKFNTILTPQILIFCNRIEDEIAR